MTFAVFLFCFVCDLADFCLLLLMVLLWLLNSDDSCSLQLDSSQMLVLSDKPLSEGVTLQIDEGKIRSHVATIAWRVWNVVCACVCMHVQVTSLSHIHNPYLFYNKSTLPLLEEVHVPVSSNLRRDTAIFLAKKVFFPRA